MPAIKDVSKKSTKKVLILALSGIGNLIMQLPTIETLKKFHPNWRITVWVAPRGTKAIAQSCSAIDRVIEEPFKKTPFNHVKFAFKLAQEKFDIGIVLSPGQLWKGAAYLFLAGIPRRIGNSYPFQGDAQSGFLLTDAITEDPALHDIEQNLRLLEPLGIKQDYSQFKIHYSLAIPDNFETTAKETIARLNVPSDTLFVGMHPGSASGFEWKRWPVERFAEVGREIIEQYQNSKLHILVFGGPEEKEIKQRLCEQIGSSCSIIDADLLTSAALIKHCKLFLTNDSGLMHISAAVDTPTIALFGPTDENQTGPRGSRSVVMRAPGTKPSYNTETKHKFGTNTHETLLKIDVKMVIDAIDKTF